jgi:nitroreductase
MTSLNDRSSLLAFLKSRKSASAKAMGPPGPDAAQLAQMLAIAVRVPDHGKLTPWRFVVFEGEARSRAGDAFAARYAELHPAHGAEALSFVKGILMRAPVVVAVVSRAAEHPKIPVWEQQLSSGAVCFNLVLAAQALGFDAQWQTDWIAYDAGARAIIGLSPGEAISGFIYIGTSTAPLEERPRPDPAALATRWGA